MYQFIKKLHLDKYLNHRLVLVLDLLISFFASFIAFLFIRALVAKDCFMGELSPWWIFGSIIVSFIPFAILKTHKSVIRHSTLHELWKISVATIFKVVLYAGLLFLAEPSSREIRTSMFYFLACDAVLTFTFLVLARVCMLVVYNSILFADKKRLECKNLLVYGVKDKSVAALARFQTSTHNKVSGFIAYKGDTEAHIVAECPVHYFGNKESLEDIVRANAIDAILFATDEDAQREQDRLVKYCVEIGLKILIIPNIDEVVGGKLMKNQIREIRIEDLLGRPEIKISLDEIKESLAGKTVMVTGAAGSIGSELCRQLAGFKIKQLILFDNAETPMHNLRLELEERFPDLDFRPVIGDVRMSTRLDFAFRKYCPKVVFHAAAYKHVPLMEENPCEAICVNVQGSKNVADKCIEFGVEKMVMISTDKAVNPTNIMGCSKRLAEIYVQSLGLAISQGKHEGSTKFVTTRFGNVLGSNGSVIPRFREQIAKGGPVTVTHPDITRFFMTIPEACRLVMEASTISTGNQICVFDMGESVKINDLARKMIKLAGLVPGKDINIEYTGLRFGEKLYEEVLSDKENTLPTSHDRIRIAKVREYSYEDANKAVEELYSLAKNVQIPEMVKLMKQIVPEFISKNSKFEEFDKSEK